ncbi:spore coat U domain-containing protein [Hydrogenophaga sp.]|jgi:spore coat protein U-like protein|uniref:Csu type fimbrial protein n=1 Tax=Hydrogenophaga sp. TaxID=1904254 RepID=UPI00271A50BB|nr:spore coat U domain-containing protein [Hydrogenophaga sp.]MDO9135882.1 spore coat U domain-containing protein [Hydrogenophaga sp.]
MTLHFTALRRARRAALLLAVLGGAAPAWGATTCTASSPNLSFGNVVMNVGPVDTAATVTVQCNTFGLSLLATARVRMCLRIGNGSGGVSGGDRLMKNTHGDALRFHIYRDAARSQIWGADTANEVKRDLEYSVPVLGGSGSTTATMYGRVPAQAGLAEGAHSSNFSGADAVVLYRYAEQLLGTPAYPASCTSGGDGGGSISFPFTATANVPSTCTITNVAPLQFGSVSGLIQANVDQSTTLNFTCTGRTAWQVSLDNGLHASGQTRRMQMGTSHVSYELYRDDARTQRWGNTPNTDTAPGTGTGGSQSLTVYGRVPQPQSVTPGAYADTVLVTIHY